MDILKWFAVSLAVLTLSYAGLTAFGAWRWKAAMRALVAALGARRLEGGVTRYDAAEIVGLPAPVHRYFERALRHGQPIIRAVDLSQSGTFNLSLVTPQWKPFTARQQVTTARPGFVWDATILMFPAVAVRVVDAYIAGEGMLRPAILGLFPLGAVRGKGEIARGELMRYFAEAVWYPTALLPSQGVVWQAADDSSARATISDGEVSLTLLFRFGADGLVAEVHADARGGMVGKSVVMMPWDCRMSEYRRQDGMLVPVTGVVIWQTPQGEKPYYRGKITRLAYTFAQ
ncbi:DUF6920 family protein [Cypionkella psychrotolerans]|uniref:DUF6920 family protein n=1 Tax=Cypionkella psychrotolerans TaxID=1678131 RepID=UPI0006B559FB|nr:DUF6544 family protein [Cypionkella psychrotolerans]